MKVLKNYMYNMSYQILLLIVPLVTMPYISRVLGPKGLGTYAYTNSVVSYFLLLGSLGITLYGSRQIAYVQDNREKRSKLFFEITILKLLTTLFSGILLASYLFMCSEFRVLLIAQSLTLFANVFDVSWYFMGVEDFKKNVIRNVIVKIASLILIFSFVRTNRDLLLYIIIIGGSTLIGNIVLIPFLINQVEFFNIKNLNVIQHLKPAILLFLPQVATQIYLVVNKTMLGQMDSVSAVGFFSSSDTLVRLALTIVSSLSAVLMPRIANLIAEGKTKSVEYYMNQSFEFINVLALPLMMGLAAISSTFVPLFLGAKFSVVALLVIMESPVILIISWSIAITNQYLIPSRMNREYIISTILGALSNVSLNVILISNFGVYGAIIATFVSELIVMVYLVYSIRKYLNVTAMLFSNFYKYAVGSFIMFGVTRTLSHILPATIVSVILEIFVGIATYFITLFLLKADILQNWRNFFHE
ncbi:flippase [Leuconostoc sp. UCMA20149]|uniref:flippase n=1 Tax=Leuconostoc sp. UCMA20149 TaxID=2583528 RepID=UPI0025B0566B|nr:flippase [Leuconostoc sp. UCMA20149]MDN2451457.1 flippase [Leuconostoc sp. UCMA20149]